MNIEQEGAIGEDPGAAMPAGGSDFTGDGGVIKVVVAFMATALLSVLGWLYKNRRSSQALEDTTNDITVETLQSARLYIVELEGQKKTLLGEIGEIARAQIAAEGSAARSAVQAALAEEAANRAKDAAHAAQSEATEARRLLVITQAYVRVLRSAMIAAGIEPPPEPQP